MKKLSHRVRTPLTHSAIVSQVLLEEGIGGCCHLGHLFPSLLLALCPQTPNVANMAWL